MARRTGHRRGLLQALAIAFLLAACKMATCLSPFKVFNAKADGLLGQADQALGCVSTPQQRDECCCQEHLPKDHDPALQRNVAFIIGVQKSGTTYIHEELIKRHPSIRAMKTTLSNGKVVDMKEPHFFDRVEVGSFAKYMELVPPSEANVTFLDSTPDYIQVPSAACRIAATFPRAKLIVVLKDPVSRAFSGWNMLRTMKENLVGFDEEVRKEIQALRSMECSFEPALAKTGVNETTGRRSTLEEENPRVAGTAWQRMQGLRSWNECFRCTFSYCHRYGGEKFPLLPTGSICPGGLQKGFVRRGHYAYQIEWWLKHFPKEQMLFINYGEVSVDSERVLDKIITFLGHDPRDKIENPPRKSFGFRIPHNKTHHLIYADVINELYGYYEHSNRELYRLMEALGPESGWWGEFPTEFAHSKRQQQG